MDSLLFLIKKQNNNKTAGYNDKVAINMVSWTRWDSDMVSEQRVWASQQAWDVQGFYPSCFTTECGHLPWVWAMRERREDKHDERRDITTEHISQS